MTRHVITLRTARVEDALFLVEVWSDVLRRGDRQEQVADVELVVKDSLDSAERRVVVAEVDGAPAGAVLLRVTTLTPLNLEPVVQAVSPHVLPEFRRIGVGRMLVEAAAAYAEELGVAHIATGAVSGSRDANRFMARLGLGPHAVLRVAPTALVRAKVEAQRPPMERHRDRARNQLLAARRSRRRQQSDQLDRPE